MMLPIVNEVVRKMIKYDKTFHNDLHGGGTKEVENNHSQINVDSNQTLETVVHSNDTLKLKVESTADQIDLPVVNPQDTEDDVMSNPLYQSEKAHNLQAGILSQILL